MSLQKVSICDIPPHCYNQVRLEERGSGVEATVTEPVSVHLKDLDIGYIRVLKQVVHMEVGVEGIPPAIQGNGEAVVDLTALYGCLQRADMPNKRTYMGGWHICHKPGDCGS